MERDRLEEYYRFRWTRWVGPLYYDHPDGEDLAGKLAFCGEVAFLITAPMGIMNAYIQAPLPTSQMGRLVRVLSAVVPGVGMGLAFAATTYYATKIRQQDDYINHCLGGLAAGVVFGAATKYGHGVYASFILSGLAGAMKGASFHHPPHPKRNFSPFLKRSLDFSGYPNKGDNWVKAPAPQN